jgi:two-component system, OmpR family, sensor kinase
VSRLRAWSRRLPIRIKLALTFSCAMAVVLGASALFLYLRFEDELDTSIDQALASRADAAAVLTQQGNFRLAIASLGREEGFGELVRPDGRVLGSTVSVGSRMLIPAKLLAQARARDVYFELKHLEGITGHGRLIARPVGRNGKGLLVVAGTTLKDRERANESLVRALVIGTPLAFLLASIVSYFFAAGALRPVEQMRSRAATIYAGETDARLPLPEAQDEIRRLGETLNAMLARLQSAFARERAFVADASHELRTPLAILKTELELALREGRSNEELTAAIRSAAEEVDRLSRLAEDLLVLARTDHRRLPVQIELVDVEPLLRDLVEPFRCRADGRELAVDAPVELRADVDPTRVRQALGNLVDNALRHGAGEVRVSAVQSNGTLELHVTDHGPGFSPDFLPHAFERFSRGDHARARGGTGLGLAIVDAIARAHGGSAHAANTGDGSDVWVELPLQSRRRSNGSTAQSPPNSSAASTPATTTAAPE